MDDRFAGWLLALAIGATLVAAARRAGRPEAFGAAALLLLYMVVLAMTEWLSPAWRPYAPAVAAAAVWLAVQPLLGLGRLRRDDIGLAPPRPGSLPPALAVTGLALAANAAVILMRSTGPVAVPPVWIVAVIVSAIVEEFVLRGVILALADRALPPRWTLWGARIGTGGLLVTGAFIALHGVRPGLLLGVAPAAMLYLWLRARTGSLLPPMLAHILWNLSVVLLNR
ncbi:MAG TPA: CPBP family intramembrane metalloprotease [Burkholderiaceae bacterium]|nr:CPBP family intramembrane metalloprotease [Burkholderiaceae bacterium]HQR70319.1 CPBP family intramembrane metalloprotease [Burkholderiaceae bacterium]